MIRIRLTSVLVDDQQKAKAFYTEKLGFQLKQDIPMGPSNWLTVVSPDEPDNVEVLLEPMGGVAAAPAFQKEMYDAGIPATAFTVDDIDEEYQRLTALGVTLMGPPSGAGMGPRMLQLDDTCGNWIQLFQL